MIKFVLRKIMIKKRKKLTYTKAMTKQDMLWNSKDEDLDIMYSLHKSIIAEAKENGWQGFSETFICNQEVVTEFYSNRNDKINEKNCYFSCGKCKDLLKALEKEINVEWFETVKALGLTTVKKTANI